MSLAPYVRILGRGPGRARPLDRAEAAEAMRIIMAGQADPESLGALLMLMRYRGESAGEIAGLVEAIGETLAGQVWRGIGAALDWPRFAAGRRAVRHGCVVGLLVAQPIPVLCLYIPSGHSLCQCVAWDNLRTPKGNRRCAM